MKWDLFCRVVDNHGDAGVCWRLAADLAARGEPVRLFIDDAAALRWMAPRGAVGLGVEPWHAAESALPGDVVIEAFGCDPPAPFLSRMATAASPPLWIDLEYLSAESYVERSHGLPSPQSSGPAAGLTRWFFYPGFTGATGGLIRESSLAERRDDFDADAWLAAHGIVARPGERRVSLFCYPQAPIAALLYRLAEAPTLLLVTAPVRVPPSPAAVRVQQLPYLSQPDYDHLLWACELNFVRGEDSFVRAQWAGVPFVWQIYPQDDGVHLEKLHAFLDRFLAGAAPAWAQRCRELWLGWNRAAHPLPPLPDMPGWREQVVAWRGALQQQTDLTTQLIRFANEKG